MTFRELLQSGLSRAGSASGRASERWVVAGVLLLALAVRCARAALTHVVNGDAGLYIYQAKAVLGGLWSQVNACSIHYLSAHPLLTALLYPLFNDWVVSARAVSILFGTLTILPLYCLSRLYFGIRTSALVAILFAVMPVFTSVSVDIGRDPAYWLFLASGVYFFAAGMLRGKPFYLAFCSVCFLLATWNRIEALLYILVTMGYLLLVRTDAKKAKIAFFFAPLLFAAAAYAGIQVLLSKGLYWYRFQEASGKLFAALDAYRDLRVNLRDLMHHPPGGIRGDFFECLRSLVWFLGLGVLLENALEAFFYPFFFLGALGLWAARKEFGQRHVAYFLSLAVFACALLYVHILQWWVLSNRYLVPVILPSFVFLGYGIERLSVWMRHRFGLKESVAVAIILSLILLSTAPKNFRHHERDKLVFKEIGQFLARQEGPSREIDILTIGDSLRFITFYANMDTEGLSCPDKHLHLDRYTMIVGGSYAEFVQNVASRNIRYVVWEERNWPSRSYDLMEDYDSEDFEISGRWEHRDTGRIVVFKKR